MAGLFLHKKKLKYVKMFMYLNVFLFDIYDFVCF